MTLNQLTYFQKIAQLEHFRLAANELNISQPSLSRSMDTLENELGIPLFEKNGKICRLDMYIFEEVCALMAKWENMGRRQIPVSVNLSRQHFRKPDFLSEFSGHSRALQGQKRAAGI